MGDTKRQHYVPRTYLKHFSFDGKRLHTFLLGKDITSVITEENKNQFIKDISLSDVCVSQDYYTIDESNSNNNRGLKAMCLEKDFFQDFAEPKLTLIIKTFEELAHKILNDKQIFICGVFSAVFHNIGQISAASVIMKSFSVFTYLPILIISGIITGLLTGFSAQFIYQRLKITDKS
jgi:hypothetical protein